jgi:hypothetical protein
MAWILRNPIQAATALGAVAYVLVIGTYRSALRPFGATPADVGIGYVDAVWPILGIVCYICIVAALLAAVLPFEAFYRVLRSRALPVIALFVLILIPTVVAIFEESEYTKAVRAGQPYDLSRDRLTVLSALRATLVRIVWKDSKDGKPSLPATPVLFLGSANGIAVIYDYRARSTVRLPLTDIVITDVLTLPPERAK